MQGQPVAKIRCESQTWATDFLRHVAARIPGRCGRGAGFRFPRPLLSSSDPYKKVTALLKVSRFQKIA